VRATAQRKIVRLPHNVNDPEFVDALVAAFGEIAREPVTAAGTR
jgi:uncharacterized protein (UPF0261 family)